MPEGVQPSPPPGPRHPLCAFRPHASAASRMGQAAVESQCAGGPPRARGPEGEACGNHSAAPHSSSNKGIKGGTRASTRSQPRKDGALRTAVRCGPATPSPGRFCPESGGSGPRPLFARLSSFPQRLQESALLGQAPPCSEKSQRGESPWVEAGPPSCRPQSPHGRARQKTQIRTIKAEWAGWAVPSYPSVLARVQG